MPDHATALVKYTAHMAAHDIPIKGKANKYTSLNGNMFSFLDKDGHLYLRLSPEDQARHDATHGTGPVMQHGSVMRGYVHLPDALWNDDAALAEIIVACIHNAQSLKPKPTKKSAKKP